MADKPISFKTQDLKKVYRTGETEVAALRGVTIEIPEAELVVMLGPSTNSARAGGVAVLLILEACQRTAPNTPSVSSRAFKAMGLGIHILLKTI